MPTGVVHGRMTAKGPNKTLVLVGVVGAMVVAGIPFISKTVRQREQKVAEMRDAVYDAKDAARNARLSIKRD